MSDKRQQLIDTATRLFRRHGYHATGIDRIAREAGVTKRTMYSYFRSKEELILTVLRDYDSIFRNEFMKSVTAASSDPEKRLLSIFDIAYEWFNQSDFFGCMFINTVGEYAEENTAIKEACAEHKRLMYQFIVELARDTTFDDPETIATTITLLFQGAIVTAQVSGDAEAAKRARTAAEMFLQTAPRGTTNAA